MQKQQEKREFLFQLAKKLDAAYREKESVPKRSPNSSSDSHVRKARREYACGKRTSENRVIRKKCNKIE